MGFVVLLRSDPVHAQVVSRDLTLGQGGVLVSHILFLLIFSLDFLFFIIKDV